MPMHMHIDRGSAQSRPPVRPPRGAMRYSMAGWTGFIDETCGYEKSPDGTVPPGGRIFSSLFYVAASGVKRPRF